MFVDADKCAEFGLDAKRVVSIARRISNAAKEAEALGVHIFGGTGAGTLRVSRAEKQGPTASVIADLDGTFDGGDGGDIY